MNISNYLFIIINSSLLVMGYLSPHLFQNTLWSSVAIINLLCLVLEIVICYPYKPQPYNTINYCMLFVNSSLFALRSPAYNLAFALLWITVAITNLAYLLLTLPSLKTPYQQQCQNYI